MSEHHADLHWSRTSSDFRYDSYNREHELRFKGGTVTVRASAAPEYRGDGKNPDPEELFVGSLSACHMLSFLAIAARKRLIVDRYDDSAVGILEKGANGRLCITQVVLRPRVQFGGDAPVGRKTLDDIHHLAHEACFIANSVTTNVSIEPQA
jgi:organic hydroperoxide reductase OsmC/OhrA